MATTILRARKVYLVYQCGLANVFTDRAGRLLRDLQGAFASCEYFARGAYATGAEIIVKHCDRAGDIAHCQDDWRDGPGEMFGDAKSTAGFEPTPEAESKVIRLNAPNY